VIVAFAATADAGERRAARAAVGAELLDTVVPRVQVLEVPGGSAAAAADELAGDDGVAWAEPDVRRTLQAAAPNDALFGFQWALRNTGQYNGTPGSDIDALSAWDVSRGAGILVGVVDSGVAAAHEDTGTLQINAGELPANGLDDDGNGFVDDVRGWDFVGDDADPADDNGHGTAVGSVINAATGNGVGIAGVAPDAEVVHAKALAADGTGFGSDVAAAMDYVARRGARIVNLSLGGGRSRSEAAVIAAYPDTLFVVAAGNDGRDNDLQPGASYPCAEPAANVLCVGWSTSADTRSPNSNYGRTTVDVMAPGGAIAGASLSTQPYELWSGTSFASPVTAGIAALVRAHRPSASVATVKAAILRSVDPVAAFAPVTVAGGRVDARRALKAVEGPIAALAPEPVAPEPVAPPPVAPEPVAPEPAAQPVPDVRAEPVRDDAPPLAPAAALPAGAPSPRVPARPVVRLEPGLRLGARRTLLLRLTTSGADGRQVAVRLLANARRAQLLGAGSVRALSPRTQTVRVALTRRGRAVLRAGRALTVRVELRLGGRVGRTTLRIAARQRR
jgi:subtilisin family serine protease